MSEISTYTLLLLNNNFIKNQEEGINIMVWDYSIRGGIAQTLKGSLVW